MSRKRLKQYKKLMEQFSMTFGFREPYQVLVDSEMVKDSCRFKMELTPALERTVRGKVKPMITQCEIRKLYAQNKEPGVNEAIELAKTFERRRCGHHPDEYPTPLSTEECFSAVVDPKSTGQNKHRYVVASQDVMVRRTLRTIRGVPLIYIKRSVMILEPMADESVQVRARDERSKFRAGLKSATGKRKRGAEDEEGGGEAGHAPHQSREADDDDSKSTQKAKKKKKSFGAKGPNPLSVKKPKKKPPVTAKPATEAKPTREDGATPSNRKRMKTKTGPEESVDGLGLSQGSDTVQGVTATV